MAVPYNAATDYDLVSTGAASYAGIPLRIIDKDSIDVFADGIQVSGASFSVSAVTTAEPYTFTLDLSPVIETGKTILIIQRYPVQREADMSPGQELTAAGYNTSLDDITLMLKDELTIQDKTNMRYDLGVSNDVTAAMKAIPIPTGEDNSLVWSTASGFSWAANHPGGQTIGEFKSQLAAEGGAALVGYNTGAGATTVQLQVAANVTGIATNLASLNALTTAATAPDTGGSMEIMYWSATDGVQRSVGYELKNRPLWISKTTIALTQAASAADPANFYYTTSLT